MPSMHPWLLFILATLCAARLTRIVVADKLTAPLRLRVFRKYPPVSTARGGPAHPIGQLIDCPWCIGYWVSAAVTVGVALCSPLLNGVFMPLLWWHAIAWAQSIVTVRLDG